MRAPAVQLCSHTEAVSAEGQRQPDNVIGIDQIVRRRSQIELGEDASDHIQLDPLTRVGSAPSH